MAPNTENKNIEILYLLRFKKSNFTVTDKDSEQMYNYIYNRGKLPAICCEQDHFLVGRH